MNWYGYDEDMDYDEECYDNGECDCDHHYSRHEPAKTYPYCSMKPVIRTNVPKLKDMTSATVAVSLWKHINILPELFKGNHDCAKGARIWNSFKREVEESLSQLPIPHSVQEQIGEYIVKVKDEIINWATYHFRSVFLNRAKDYIVYNYIEDLIWNCDGTINCVETAKLISRSKLPRVSDVEKFNFLCMYCLKDDMRQMSPVSMKIFQEYVDFDQHPLICYWNRYFSNELRSIPRAGNVSLDCVMFRHRFVDNWPAKEYFFDHLSPEVQVQNTIWLIDECGLTYQKIILKKLNESQRIAVYMERSAKIITNYVRTKTNFTDALETWYEVRNIITRRQFVGLFSSLLELEARTDGRILTDVWISADTAFKHYFFTFNNYEYTRKILNSFHWTKDINFLTTLLKDLNAANLIHATKQIFVDFCETLYSTRENFQWLDRLFDVYFGEESKQFKADFVLNSKSIKSLCLKYYSSRQLKSLKDVLTDLFAQMPDRIPEYKRNLLHSPEGISICADLLGFDTNYLIEIIADVLPTTNLAIEFRKKFVFSTPVIKKLKTWLANKNLNDLNGVIDNFLISEQDKVNLKKSLLGEPTQFIRDCFLKSNDSYLQSILVWVFEKQNLVKEFKETIPVNDIFDKMLEERCGFPYYRGIEFDSNFYKSLDRFLIWRLGSPSEEKKYKLKRIYSYTKINAVASLLRKRTLEQAKRLQSLMEWFFENDAAEIARFNQIYQRRGKIAKIL